ncbi:hypothetical protein POVCU2_0049370 [Plasmodium ovale curtisi]|uniref:Uncharacterized protein n=1 Tax=Plasmodium ovale curtisi TaxID=864141 RepID=A0A1A8X3P9_PLAOA|nr:hypothetical protein POVCU2_0049370 [Plasmodium ovale curtisi]SBS98383.1 hypothetical protein POVCU1_045730 [Plasmodium ovale curtisi]
MKRKKENARKTYAREENARKAYARKAYVRKVNARKANARKSVEQPTSSSMQDACKVVKMGNEAKLSILLKPVCIWLRLRAREDRLKKSYCYMCWLSWEKISLLGVIGMRSNRGSEDE